MSTKSLNLKKIYDRDYALWLEKTAELLKQKNFKELDLENLIEEIETLGRSEKNKIISSLRLIYHHLLKWKYQPNLRSKSWKNTIERERDNIADYLEDTPSLKKLLEDPEVLEKAYRRGRRDAIKETGITTLPNICPFALEQVLEKNKL